MKTNKPSTLKRTVAYLIDLLIITILSSILITVFTDTTTYEKEEKKVLELAEKLTTGEITREEYLEKFDSANYDLTRASVKITAASIAMSVVYYVVLCYFCKGITLGKFMLKLRIVSNNGKKLNILNFLSRSLITNLILSNVVTIVLIKLLSKEQYISVYTYVQNAFSLIMVTSFLFIMYRKDDRGIGDFMANTKVVSISTKDKEIEDTAEETERNEEKEEKEKVKDAVIVEKKPRGRKKKEVE